ncbi:Rossmann-fold NAD(P)-binding domain-containing protein [Streptomyces collinus]
MVDGVLLVAAGRSVRPLDIGGDEEPTAAETARPVIELTGSDSPLAFVEDVAAGRTRPRPVTGFAREIFGRLPSVTWQDSPERTVAAFRGPPEPFPTPGGETTDGWAGEERWA